VITAFLIAGVFYLLNTLILTWSLENWSNAMPILLADLTSLQSDSKELALTL
jgi:hypothetical protein